MTAEEQNILKRIGDSIRKSERGVEAFLFGSRARGDAKKDSDWDILILSDSDNFLEVEEKVRDKIYRLELESGQIISLLTYSKKYWHNTLSVTPLYKSVLKEGIKL